MDKGEKPVDAPMTIILLRDADKCAVSTELQQTRSKMTIEEVEREYAEWWESML